VEKCNCEYPYFLQRNIGKLQLSAFPPPTFLTHDATTFGC